ncbi:hypothetical protein D4764_21G0004190 [Takifugu flavidus]|uniref:Uncharacterized protein n=1 Tax=Takifugu flavidus TaxID=433684 RepID=A0A5C6NFT1_9TELE|nr:hypothetical protein D4764_21G0004190 [Takifugu flavidus]
MEQQHCGATHAPWNRWTGVAGRLRCAAAATINDKNLKVEDNTSLKLGGVTLTSAPHASAVKRLRLPARRPLAGCKVIPGLSRRQQRMRRDEMRKPVPIIGILKPRKMRMVLFDPFLFSSFTTLLLQVALILLVNLFPILTIDLVVTQFVWLSEEETTRSLSLARREPEPGLKTEDKKAKRKQASLAELSEMTWARSLRRNDMGKRNICRRRSGSSRVGTCSRSPKKGSRRLCSRHRQQNTAIWRHVAICGSQVYASCWQIRFLIKIIYFLRHGGNINLTEPPCEAAACLPQAQMALHDPSERARSCRIEEVWAAMLVMLTLGEEEEEEEEGKITPSVRPAAANIRHPRRSLPELRQSNRQFAKPTFASVVSTNQLTDELISGSAELSGGDSPPRPT